MAGVPARERGARSLEIQFCDASADSNMAKGFDGSPTMSNLGAGLVSVA